jgi:cellulose synthase/poly-beta-1,6-N-acetylglucosamine synthase-like glycosyltransferase
VTTPKLLIGAPVLRREWIIERWLDHVALAMSKVDLDYSLIFVGGEDDPTFKVISDWCNESGISAVASIVEEPRPVDKRYWDEQRFYRMIEIRNHLLSRVREMSPDYFLSLDSDILIHQDLITNLYESAQNFDAVGGKCYMTRKGRVAPSYGAFGRANIMRRPEAEGVFRVDVIMAIKMMTPKAYNVDYSFDVRGEDIGWSKDAVRAGCLLGWDGRVVSKHVMEKEDLDRIDDRCGY